MWADNLLEPCHLPQGCFMIKITWERFKLRQRLRPSTKVTFYIRASMQKLGLSAISSQHGGHKHLLTLSDLVITTKNWRDPSSFLRVKRLLLPKSNLVSHQAHSPCNALFLGSNPGLTCARQVLHLLSYTPSPHWDDFQHSTFYPESIHSPSPHQYPILRDSFGAGEKARQLRVHAAFTEDQNVTTQLQRAGCLFLDFKLINDFSRMAR